MEDITFFIVGVCLAIVAICVSIFSVALTYKFFIDFIV